MDSFNLPPTAFPTWGDLVVCSALRCEARNRAHRPRAFSEGRSHDLGAIYGCAAHCRAVRRGKSKAQKGAAAEESVRVMRLAGTTSHAPVRSTFSRKRRKLHPILVAFSMARRTMCMT